MKKALAVVAHFDDHILWMGATIERLAKKGWSWTLIVMCEAETEHARREYFSMNCALWDANEIVHPFVSEQDGQPFSTNSKAAMLQVICEDIQGQSFDAVFTHSRRDGGEYGGHRNHDEVRIVTEEIVHSGCTGVNSPIYFSYKPIPGVAVVADTTPIQDASRYFVCLTYQELRRKAALAAVIPDNLSSIGNPCPNPEAFESAVPVPSDMEAVS